jgi:hypothetical protein
VSNEIEDEDEWIDLSTEDENGTRPLLMTRGTMKAILANKDNPDLLYGARVEQPKRHIVQCWACNDEGRGFVAKTFDGLTGLWVERFYPASTTTFADETIVSCPSCKGKP